MTDAGGQVLLDAHVCALHRCTACPGMHKPVVSGPAVWSKVLLIGQAPGVKEPQLGRPFAWTAGKTLFRWFKQFCGVDEERFRQRVYMAAVCRCFPGKNKTGGDRVPDPAEIQNCSGWLEAEMALLNPGLVIPVGRLAISQFIAFKKLTEVIGGPHRVPGRDFDLIPLPHPSGASTWHRMEPGRSLLAAALGCIRDHASFSRAVSGHGRDEGSVHSGP